VACEGPNRDRVIGTQFSTDPDHPAGKGMTGTAFTVTKYFAVASSRAKQMVASAISPIAFSLRRGSVIGAEGSRRGARGVMRFTSICTSPCQKAMRR